MTINEIYSLFCSQKCISTDSRNIIKDSIFFALKGSNFNGNQYALEAIQQGAAYSIVDDINLEVHPSLIQVKDVLQTLQDLANFHRKQLKIPVIAITGTNGKTTTKELLQAVLSKKYKSIATKGNLNNHIGVPLSLLSINETHEIAVIEMGANHIGEIESLCKIAEPDYGIITNIGKAHLEGFGSFEGVIKTKTELYNSIEANKGSLFINSNNPILLKESKTLRCYKIGYGKEADTVRCDINTSKSLLSLDLLFSGGETIHINSQLTGSYNSENILAAACIGYYFKIPAQEIGNAIAEYSPNNQRSQIIQTANNTLICDYYNANPSSMDAALQNFSSESFDSKKKIVMLGGMKELGEYSFEEHKNIIALIEQMQFTEVYFVGEEFFALKNLQFKFFESSPQLANYLKQNPVKGAVILIKGSRGSKMESVIECL